VPGRYIHARAAIKFWWRDRQRLDDGRGRAPRPLSLVGL